MRAESDNQVGPKALVAHPPLRLSVILPSYNEAQNVVPLIQELKRYLTEPHEILVMDDDSPDGTGEVVRRAFAHDPSVEVHIRQQDRGLAKAIREGLERAVGERVLVMDTDFNHDPALVPQLMELNHRIDLVTGSRFCPGGGMGNVRYYAASRLYNQFLSAVLQTHVQDNLFGYFTMDRKKLVALPLDRIFYGYGDYFFRLLWYARQRGYSIAEIPAFCGARRAGVSKSRISVMLLHYTWEAVKLHRDGWRALP